jgi:aspartate-semialdehyde dehydrogenase
MLVSLKPIHDAVGIERINVATYQSVSGAGKEAVDELAEQSVALMNGLGTVKAKVLPKQIAFNCIPQIDQFEDNGYTREEMKMVWETQKIMEDPAIRVNATAVRVPVFFGHSEAVHIETRKKITADEARALLKKAPGITVLDEQTGGTHRATEQRTATQFMSGESVKIFPLIVDNL